MIILRQKKYSSIYNIDGKLVNGATDNVKRDQNYYDELGKQLKQGNSGGLTGIDPGATKIGSNAGVRTLGGQTRYNNQIKTGDIYDMGVKKGQQSVGLLGGAKNTWNNMSKGQQIATGTVAGTALVGATALALRNRRKRKEAEEELKLERARNRR